MKIIHCADIHLDSKMSTHLTKEKARERKAELLGTFQNMVAYAAEHGVQAILIAGDLFDTKNVSATARNIVYHAMVSHPEILFFYLQGNHDEGSFTAGLKGIPNNLRLFETSWTSFSIGEQDKIVITGMELNEKNTGNIVNSLSLDVEKINLVMLHGQESEYNARDKTEVIPIAGLRNKGIDYLALGHVHSYRMEKLDGRGTYCYPGCLEGRGFDECGEHGFMLLEVDEKSGQISKQFVPFASRRLYTIVVDISGCKNSAEILLRMQEQTKACGLESRCLIRYELTGQLDVQSEKDLVYLEKQMEDQFYFVRIKDESVYYVNYKDYERDISLKGEFIRTVMEKKDLSEDEKAIIIHYGMKALAGEDILEA